MATGATAGVRTGQDYVESLRDGREVWISGERVEDVTKHAAFAGVVRSVAAAYDLQHDNDLQPQLTTPSPTGALMPLSYKPPESPEDLVARREMIELYSRRTGGTMGRLPEYGGAFAVGMLNVGAEFDAESQTHVRAWFEACRDRDVLIVSTFVDPQVDRSLPAAESGLLRIVESRDDGIVVSGCKSVATMGPTTDEFLILTLPRPGLSADEMMYISVQPGTPGVRFFCREPLDRGLGERDAPLSARFDEPDAWALFNEAFIPRERVFHTGETDPARLGAMFAKTLNWAWYHNLIRVSVKAELLAGVCTLLAENNDAWNFPQVQEQVAEVIEYAQVLKALVYASEARCVPAQNGMVAPNPEVLNIAKVYGVKNYPRALEIIRELAGQGIIMAPLAADFEHEQIGPTIMPYYEARGIDAEERVRLFRLAWELTSDSFGGRQTLFELFNAGGLAQGKARVATGTDKSRYVELARSLAGI